MDGEQRIFDGITHEIGVRAAGALCYGPVPLKRTAERLADHPGISASRALETRDGVEGEPQEEA